MQRIKMNKLDFKKLAEDFDVLLGAVAFQHEVVDAEINRVLDLHDAAHGEMLCEMVRVATLLDTVSDLLCDASAAASDMARI